MTSDDKVSPKAPESDQSNGRSVSSSKAAKKSKPSVSKTKALKAKLEEAEERNAKLKDQFLRAAAEFENYKKRRESEYARLVANANAELLAELLPVLDDFERSLSSVAESADRDGAWAGVELMYKNFAKVLENRGVKPIEAVGQEFDPEKHAALMQVESGEYPSGTVVEEHTKGYLINDRVLRHSQVLVSK
jgi:molecular chaperone GrpE